MEPVINDLVNYIIESEFDPDTEVEVSTEDKFMVRLNSVVNR